MECLQAQKKGYNVLYTCLSSTRILLILDTCMDLPDNARKK